MTNNRNPSMSIDINSALFTLRFQYELTQTQLKEGASDVIVYSRTPVT